MRLAHFMFRGGAAAPAKLAGRGACTGHKARGVLVVDCRGCPKAQDLTDQECLKGVLRALAAEHSGVSEVVLSRDWDISYGLECTGALVRLAEVIQFCNGLAFEQPFEDCSACRSNPRSVVSRVVEALPQAAPELSDGRLAPPGAHGRACEQCVRSQRNNLDHATALLDQAHDAINKAAYRVVLSREH